MGGLFSSAAPAILSLIVFGILFGIGVGIGLVLVIVPGLILLTFWSVGAPAIVIEGVLGAIAAPISDGAILVASIISTTITAPIFALAVSVMFFDLGGRAAEVPAAPAESPPPT